MNQYFCGDTIEIEATLSKDDVVADLTGAMVRMCIVGSDGKTIVIGPSNMIIDGNPTEGNVVGEFTSSETSITTIPSSTFLEIEVQQDGKITTFGQTKILLRPSPKLFN